METKPPKKNGRYKFVTTECHAVTNKWQLMAQTQKGGKVSQGIETDT